MVTLSDSIKLRCGELISNRLFKSATSELLATEKGSPDQRLATLYDRWSKGGAGLLITGNVMVDSHARGEPGNVVVEDDRHMNALKAWAEAGKRFGNHIWMQVNHPGKQSPLFLSRHAPVAPSAVPLGSGFEHVFRAPRALEDDEIESIIERFGRTAAVAKQAGFTGVQIHGAHGYLVNQFLSPHHNRRNDRWGGSLENRASFVMKVYQSMRKAVGDHFPVSIKINSSDFQKDGFDTQESTEVIAALADAGIDLVEISGGTYEAQAMSGMQTTESAKQREAYFISFAETLRTRVKVPLAVTGGFRTAKGMKDAVESGAVDLVGLARPLTLDPDLPRKVLAGQPYVSQVRTLSTGFKFIDKLTLLNITYYENQIARMAEGKSPNPSMSPWVSLVMSGRLHGIEAFRTRRA